MLVCSLACRLLACLLLLLLLHYIEVIFSQLLDTAENVYSKNIIL